MYPSISLLWFVALHATLVTIVRGFRAGVGLSDMTGPASEVNMMGYAIPSQNSAGIHFRLYARAFVLAKDGEFDSESNKPIAFVSMDNGMASQALRAKVLQRLEPLFPGMYTEQNLCLSGTHTHSGTAGYLQYTLFQIMSLGFIKESFNAMVDGIVDAIREAHVTAMDGAQLRVSSGTLNDTNINRSPSSYAANPAAERAKYSTNTDNSMVLLRIDNKDGNPIGTFNWFAVHGTSMPNTNTMLSGDNKGYASALFEDYMEPKVFPSEKTFVAAFCSTNLGDVSPNINGTFCSDTGLPCEELHSTCSGRNENCHGRGPSSDPFESTAIIARRQFNFALKLFHSQGVQVNGDVRSASINRDFSQIEITDHTLHSPDYQEAIDVRRSLNGEENKESLLRGGIDPSLKQPTTNRKSTQQSNSKLTKQSTLTNESIQQTVKDTNKRITCPSALGFSFAAGTTDGPGDFDFTQGDKSGSLFWDFVRDFVAVPTKKLKQCQHPKPVLLATGEVTKPYPWHPSILGLQMFMIGKQLCIVAVPCEFTTMAGRRLKEMLRMQLVNSGTLAENGEIVIAGLANGYSHYVTTYEEYQVQRYEGASTLYGPWTHAAYMQELKSLSSVFTKPGSKIDPGPPTPNFVNKAITLLPPVMADEAPAHSYFGKVVQQPILHTKGSYSISKNGIVVVVFQSASLRNNIRRNDSFFLVQQWVPTLSNSSSSDGHWRSVRSDAHLDTRFSWSHHGVVVEQSLVKVEWHLGWKDQSQPVQPGNYRILHFGTRKYITGKLEDFRGESEVFKVVK